jgi:hypothetical protein
MRGWLSVGLLMIKPDMQPKLTIEPRPAASIGFPDDRQHQNFDPIESASSFGSGKSIKTFPKSMTLAKSERRHYSTPIDTRARGGNT